MLPVNPLFYSDKSKMKLAKIDLQRTTSIVEKTSLLSIAEKINIISLLVGYKWVTDVAIDSSADQKPIKSLLDTLGLFHASNHYTYQGETHTWIQVAATEALLDYVIERRNELSVVEAGVLYGYPVSHTLGYVGLIEKKWKNRKTIAEFYLSGVYSEKYSERESEYFESVWAEIIKTCPGIQQQANDFYNLSTSE